MRKITFKAFKARFSSFKETFSQLKYIIIFFFLLITQNGFSQGASCNTAFAANVNTNYTGLLTDTTINDPTVSVCTGPIYYDGWISFVAISSNATVTQDPNWNRFNPILYAYSGTCGTPTQIGCADNFGNNGTETLNLTGLITGNTYYIRIGNAYNQAVITNNRFGIFNIIQGPDNDLCANAITLNCNDVNIAGTSLYTSNIPSGGTGCALSNYGVWYTFVGDGNQTTIIAAGDTNSDLEMAIAYGSCGTLTNITCEDDTALGGVESYTFDTVNGTNYYIYIADYSTSGSFAVNFNISRTCVDTCNPTSTPNQSDLACPSVIAAEITTGNNPITLDFCNAASVNLEATYLDIGDTTSYTVSDISGTEPPSDFGCLANQVSLDLDDIWSPTITLPFNFCFYGQTYNSCVIGSNGVISFDTSLAGLYTAWATFENVPHPTENAYEIILPFLYQFHYGPSIYGVHNDIDPRFGGEVGWELITLNTGCRALVASWNEVPLFLNANAGDLSKRFTSMIVLYEDTNVIEVFIKEKVIDDDVSPGTPWNDGNASIGIQNVNGTLGLSPAGRNIQDANWTATNEAYRFTPSGGSITSLTWYEGSGTGGANLGATDIIAVSPVVPTTYTAAVTYTLCDTSTITVTDEVIVNPTGKIWLGGDTTIGPNTDPEDWNNPENWLNNTVPIITDCVIVPDRPNDPIIYDGDSGYGDFMRIYSDAIVTLEGDTGGQPFSGNPTASTLTIQSFIENNGVLNIEDDASLVQIDNIANTGSGTVNVIRESIINDVSDYVYWATPIAGFDIGSIPGDLTYQWTPTINGNGTGNHGDWQGASGAMATGKGYIKRASTTPSITTTFSGVNSNLNNGDITTVAITSGNYNVASPGGDYNTSGSIANATLDDDNWNLLGNPYPSSIDATKFLNANTNLAGYIDVWSHGTAISDTEGDPFYYDFGENYTISDYIRYNASGSAVQNGFHGNIASGQGFMVLMNHVGASYPNNGTVTFTNNMRYSGVSPYSHYGNNQFYRLSDPNHGRSGDDYEERHRIWLGLISPTEQVYSSLVAYTTNSTMQKDRLYDAQSNEINGMNIYSLIDNERFVIQGRSLPFDQNDQVPIGVLTTTSGIHTIAINGVDGLFENDAQPIYLEDLELYLIHNLREQPYTFTAEPGKHDQRFVLRYTNNSLTTDEFNSLTGLTISAPNSEYIKVESYLNEIDNVTIFDILGRKIVERMNMNLNEVQFTNIGQSNVLIVKVTLTNGTQKIQKVILK